MWLALVVAVLAVAGLVGGAFAGGIFTIVLIPIAAIALIALFIGWLWARATAGASASTTTESADTGGGLPASSLPRTRGGSGAHAPTSPERLADLRREQQ